MSFLFSFLSYLVKELAHRLLRQLDAQERSRVRGHSSGQRRAQAGEEGPEAAAADVNLLDGAADSGVALSRLQPALDGVDREDRDPHGHASRTTGRHDGSEAQLAGLAVGRLGREAALDDLVGGEVGGGAGPVAGEGHGGAAEDGAHAALLVELAHDVEAAAVLGLLARRELLLALDLEQDLDALEGRGDERHGDGGEEAGGRGLGDGELVVVDGRHGRDELLADVVTPERHGEHGRDAHQGRRDTGIEAPSQAFPGNRPPDHIHGAAVHALLRRLQPHLDQVERVPDDDGAHAADAAGHQRAQRLQARLGRLGHLLLQLLFAGEVRLHGRLLCRHCVLFLPPRVCMCIQKEAPVF